MLNSGQLDHSDRPSPSGKSSKQPMAGKALDYGFPEDCADHVAILRAGPRRKFRLAMM
jgi:hypothetical protein